MSRPIFPRDPQAPIRTACGDLPVADLGRTYYEEGSRTVPNGKYARWWIKRLPPNTQIISNADVAIGPSTEWVQVAPAACLHGAERALEAIRDFDASQGGPVAPCETPTTTAMRALAAAALDER